MLEKSINQNDNKALSDSSFRTYPIEQLKQDYFAPGDLFLKRKKANPLKILKAGELIHANDYEKYLKFGVKSLYLKSTINSKRYEKGISAFSKFIKATDPKEQFLIRKELFLWWKDFLWESNEQVQTLELILICQKFFCHFPRDLYFKYSQSSPIHLFRSLHISSLSVIFLIILGHLDFKFLCDIYHISFLFDYSLINKRPSFHILQACEIERLQAGEGAIFLSKLKSDQSELKLFSNHSLQSFELAEKDFKKIINYHENFNLIQIHHLDFEKKEFNEKSLRSDYFIILKYLELIFPFKENRTPFDLTIQNVKKIFIENKNSKKSPYTELIKKIKDIIRNG